MKPLIGSDLKRFLRNYKRENKPKRELVILLQSVEYPYNVGAIFRLADGAGIKEVILTGITPKPPNPTIEKVARGKTRNMKPETTDSITWPLLKSDLGLPLHTALCTLR